MKKIKGLPYRDVKLSFATPFKVPRHISRVEGKKVVGWQVRYGETNRVFPDSKHGWKTSASLNAAIKFLASIYEGPIRRNIEKKVRKPGKYDYLLGVKNPPNGIHVTRKIRRTIGGSPLRGRKPEFYIVVSSLGSNPGKSFYIGNEDTVKTSHTRTQYSFALALRNRYLREYKENAT